MAIAFDATANGAVNPGTSVTFSHTCTGSNLILLLGISYYQSTTDDITAVTYNTVAMTRIITVTNSTSPTQISFLYYLLNPATGANDVVVSKTSSVDTRIVSASYTGAKQSGQADASGSATATATSISKSVTTIDDNCWMISFAMMDNPISASTGTTARNTNTTYAGLGDSNGVITPAGAYSMAWSAGSSSNASLVQASISPAVATLAVRLKSLLGVGL